MENKYYTPQIEEFHVGFEFEFMNGNNEWVKRTFCDGESAEPYCDISGEDGRVKFLDQSDIESFGFEKRFIPDVFNDDEIVEAFELDTNKTTAVFLYCDELQVRIAKQVIYNEVTGNWTADQLFQGEIKNKSELKRVLEQVGAL